ncbi:hypothetical protein CJP74_05810 [Psittacicella melopsittaci]|uniref:Uncharacterized protein n=1 Tax=Psittacicella melopsittaci TaxID=2028576 RepID=A0A3A1Y3X9_9GAMM|nr:hypothetical protein [Psittacicella melopsittaci]RIY32009.1 hypothetical protein CJP74_05810 [Psittacicella melopsittaci]
MKLFNNFLIPIATQKLYLKVQKCFNPKHFCPCLYFYKLNFLPKYFYSFKDKLTSAYPLNSNLLSKFFSPNFERDKSTPHVKYHYFDLLQNLTLAEILSESEIHKNKVFINFKKQIANKLNNHEVNCLVKKCIFLYHNLDSFFAIKLAKNSYINIQSKSKNSTLNIKVNFKPVQAYFENNVCDKYVNSVQRKKLLEDYDFSPWQAINLLSLYNAIGDETKHNFGYLDSHFTDPTNVYMYYFIQKLKDNLQYYVYANLIEDWNSDLLVKPSNSFIAPSIKRLPLSRKPFIRNPRVFNLLALFTKEQLFAFNGNFIASQAPTIFRNFSLVEDQIVKDEMLMIVNRNGVVQEIGKESELAKHINKLDNGYFGICTGMKKPYEVKSSHTVYITDNYVVIDLHGAKICSGFIAPNLKSFANVDFNNSPSNSLVKQAICQCLAQGITTIRFSNNNNLGYSSIAWIEQVAKLRKKIPQIISGINAENYDGVDFYGDTTQKIYRQTFKQQLDYLYTLEKCGLSSCTINQQTSLFSLNVFLNYYYQNKLTVKTLGKENNLTDTINYLLSLDTFEYINYRKAIFLELFSQSPTKLVKSKPSLLPYSKYSLQKNPILKKYSSKEEEIFAVDNSLANYHLDNRSFSYSHSIAFNNLNPVINQYIKIKAFKPLIKVQADFKQESQKNKFILIADMKFVDKDLNLNWLKNCNVATNLSQDKIKLLPDWCYYSCRNLEDFRYLKSDRAFMNLEHLEGNTIYQQEKLEAKFVKRVCREEALAIQLSADTAFRYYAFSEADYGKNNIKTLFKYLDQISISRLLNLNFPKYEKVNFVQLIKKYADSSLANLQYFNSQVAKAFNLYHPEKVGSIGYIRKGCLANFVILNAQNYVSSTWVLGICCHNKSNKLSF